VGGRHVDRRNACARHGDGRQLGCVTGSEGNFTTRTDADENAFTRFDRFAILNQADVVGADRQRRGVETTVFDGDFTGEARVDVFDDDRTAFGLTENGTGRVGRRV